MRLLAIGLHCVGCKSDLATLTTSLERPTFGRLVLESAHCKCCNVPLVIHGVCTYKLTHESARSQFSKLFLITGGHATVPRACVRRLHASSSNAAPMPAANLSESRAQRARVKATDASPRNCGVTASDHEEFRKLRWRAFVSEFIRTDSMDH